MSQTIELESFINPDRTAVDIAEKWQGWDNLRNRWLSEKREIQEYIFATDTTTTTNASLPWKNKVHIPKLCQIRDNLHANYMATLFASDDWLAWEGDDTDSETLEKRKTIQNYMKNKLSQGSFESEASKLVLDFIDYGNVFAMSYFEANYTTDPKTGDKIPSYIGPRLKRISPEDVVFDPTNSDFTKAPKIIRSVRTLGDIKEDIDNKPELKYMEEVFNTSVEKRRRFAAHSQGDFNKTAAFNYAGFSSFWEYWNSDYVEVLDFYGDFFDRETGELHKNYLITVIDRAYVIRKEPLDNWQGIAPIRHAGWRLRQDNLYAMGPLDNLIGLQYRIDHLENSKADAFDLIVQPVIKVTGFVEDFEYGPNERIVVGEEGDVEFMSPDTTFLNANTEIALYEQKMEEMAGAPKEAIGFRTPGEKTAFEVQSLENAANKVFVNKVSHFERVFLEPLINDMLEIARRNLNEADSIRVLDDATQAVTFQKITKEDITARGKIKPMGARHFSQNATTLQNINNFAQSPLAQDPLIASHISGKRMAQLLEKLLGVEKHKIVQPNIRLYEAAEMQQLQGSIQQAVLEQQTAQMTPEQAQQVAQQQALAEEEGNTNGSN